MRRDPSTVLASALLAPALCLLLSATLLADIPAIVTKVSHGPGGVQGNDASGSGFPSLIALSEDGRFTVFTSLASNLVPGDTNSAKDVFVHDSDTDTTIRASLGWNGAQSNGRCDQVSISADGRFVVYRSEATNLALLDFNGRPDVFLFDRMTGRSQLVSKRPNGTTGNDGSESPSISSDGRYVCFWSSASNLVAGDTNGVGDIFVWDSLNDVTTRVSTSTTGAQSNANCGQAHLSRNGRYAVFMSMASNLVPGDTNGQWDVFQKNLLSGRTTRVDATGVQLNGRSNRPKTSTDGRYIVFESEATNAVPGDTNGVTDCFIWDAFHLRIERISVDSMGAQANGESHAPVISPDGKWAAFESDATNLVAGDTNATQDVFLRDLRYEWTERVSLDHAGQEAPVFSSKPALSSYGAHVAFLTPGSLVPGDTNGVHDVYVRDRRLTGVELGFQYCDSNANSSGEQATLRAIQSPVVTDNDVLFVIDNLPSNQLGYMLMSDTQGFVSLFGGSQGNLCLGGNIHRFAATVLSTGSGSVDFQPDLTNLPLGTTILAGEGWNFQFWFRDGNPNNTSNTSAGLCVQFH